MYKTVKLIEKKKKKDGKLAYFNKMLIPKHFICSNMAV